MSSNLFDAVGPAVICDDMLSKAVMKQGPTGVAGKLAEEEGIEYSDVTSLQLDYKSILRIDGLWEFVNLTTLKLDNNIIERIEGLDDLVNLVNLDLSFNNIEVIDGLNNLTKLEDLSLFYNRITRIGNMDVLVNLQIFSIGSNYLEDIENLAYLRRFKKLRSLNLANNPFCENDEHKLYAAAYLPDLRFLDYRILDEQTKAQGYKKYAATIDSVIEKDKFEQDKLDEDAKAASQFEYYRKAYVENLDQSQLFEAMYKDDQDGLLLNQLSGVDSILKQFKEKFTETCRKLFKFGLADYHRREAEVTLFFECVAEAKRQNKEEGIKALVEFEEEKKKIFTEIVIKKKPRVMNAIVTNYNNRVTELWDKLMGLEMTLLEQLEEVIKDFERNMQDDVAVFIEKVQGFMSQLRDTQHFHMEKMTEIANVTYDRITKFEPDETMSEELQDIFLEKDTVNAALSASHDAHMLTIDNREDEIIRRINTWLANMIKNLHEEEEITRNRARVIEIARITDHFREEIENLEVKV